MIFIARTLGYEKIRNTYRHFAAALSAKRKNWKSLRLRRPMTMTCLWQAMGRWPRPFSTCYAYIWAGTWFISLRFLWWAVLHIFALFRKGNVGSEKCIAYFLGQAFPCTKKNIRLCFETFQKAKTFKEFWVSNMPDLALSCSFFFLVLLALAKQCQFSTFSAFFKLG